MRIRVGMSRASDVVGSEGMLPNYTSISKSTMSSSSAIVFGLITLLVGGWIGMGAAGIASGTKHAPDWVLWAGSVVFLSAGLMMFVQGLVDLNQQRRRRRDAIMHPDELWRADYAWMDAGSGSGMKSRDSGGWGVHAMGLTIVVCFTMVSTWVSVSASGNDPVIFLWFMTGVMYLVLVIVLIWLGTLALRVIRYGSPRMVYETLPVRPGALVNGTVLCPRGFQSLERISITLRYVIESYQDSPSRGRRGKSRVSCRGKVHDSWVIDDVSAQLGGFGTEGQIPIAFLIPEDAEDTKASDRPAQFWDLEVRGEAKGVDFVHRFAVPVYSEG
jgi:hypothetical protein